MLRGSRLLSCITFLPFSRPEALQLLASGTHGMAVIQMQIAVNINVSSKTVRQVNKSVLLAAPS